MTSMASESISTIQVSCKQTRFQVDNLSYREIDVEGLSISVSATPLKSKGKAKARSSGTEILADATLRLKAGERYALIGRNGTGKSTLLRAIAEKLIPGIPEAARISILQQTNDDSDATQVADARVRRTLLEQVIERATARDELEQEISVLARGLAETETGLGAARALRQLRHDRLQKRLFVFDKDARLRSGARGIQARKALTALEKEAAAAASALSDLTDLTDLAGTSTVDSNEKISPESIQAETQEAADLLAELQIQAEPARVAHTEARAKLILSGLGFSDAMISSYKPVGELSGGWRMRTALAATLLSEADIVLLDEPTNFLDMLGIVWLQKYLLSLGAPSQFDSTETHAPPTVVLVSHDRDFVTACTDHLVLLQPDKTLQYYTGDLAAYEAVQAESRQHLTKLKDAQDRQRVHVQDTIARNLREGRKNNDDTRIRQAKMRQKKLDDRWGLETNASGHRFKISRDMPGYHLTRRNEIAVPTEARAMHITLPEPPDLRFPGTLISLDDVCFRYGVVKKKPGGRAGSAVVVSGGGSATISISSRPPASPSPSASSLADGPWTLDGVSLSVNMGDRIGIVGLNGAGKSTLIRLLVDDHGRHGGAPGQGRIQPTRGSVAMHPRLRLAYYAQDAVDTIRSLDKDTGGAPGAGDGPVTALGLLLQDVRDAGGDMGEGELRGLLGELGLPGRLASDTPLRRLSGGQLVRCALARLLWQRPQCLVLDEVTTHLDYETSTALRQALRVWPGAVVLVSHDRWFMRGAIEGELSEQELNGVSDSDGEDSDPESSTGQGRGGLVGRKAVYRLRAGKLTLLERGVQEFEDQLERRVDKLLSM
ncbi:abc transporter [Ophiostoma piceae UAMH 11346]|uniref:Abc transporter n=1 Tax=Ophiostoma piceae (strain UAMH 11346) TaxID=1262450 RepID=S3C814_OPHP1|nr:abc transporter [Ophiostoma piceae UAMH 11346]